MNTDAPASTSLLIAAATLLHAGDTIASWEKPLARAVLEGAGAPGRRLLRLCGHAPGRGLLRLLQHGLLPGIVAHYRWRKQRIAAWTDDFLAHGTGQLLVLGAGFDPLGANIAVRHPQVRVIECDRPTSLALKQRAMARIGLAASNLRMVATDLSLPASDALAPVLAACERGRTTLVLAEGLLMYLPVAQVTALMKRLAASLPSPLALIASAMQCDAHGRAGFQRQHGLVRRWLARRGEPFHWGASGVTLAPTLARMGIAIDALADAAHPEPDPCPGEWLFRGHVRR